MFRTWKVFDRHRWTQEKEESPRCQEKEGGRIKNQNARNKGRKRGDYSINSGLRAYHHIGCKVLTVTKCKTGSELTTQGDWIHSLVKETVNTRNWSQGSISTHLEQSKEKSDCSSTTFTFPRENGKEQNCSGTTNPRLVHEPDLTSPDNWRAHQPSEDCHRSASPRPLRCAWAVLTRLTRPGLLRTCGGKGEFHGVWITRKEG